MKSILQAGALLVGSSALVVSSPVINPSSSTSNNFIIFTSAFDPSGSGSVISTTTDQFLPSLCYNSFSSSSTSSTTQFCSSPKYPGFQLLSGTYKNGDAFSACTSLNSTLANLTTDNIRSASGLITTCIGSNKPSWVQNWNFNYLAVTPNSNSPISLQNGLAVSASGFIGSSSNIYFTSAFNSSFPGAVTAAPSSLTYFPTLCQTVSGLTSTPVSGLTCSNSLNPGFSVISQLSLNTDAFSTCVKFNMKLADLTNDNIKSASDLVTSCIGSNKPVWIHSWNTDFYTPVPINQIAVSQNLIASYSPASVGSTVSFSAFLPVPVLNSTSGIVTIQLAQTVNYIIQSCSVGGTSVCSYTANTITSALIAANVSTAYVAPFPSTTATATRVPISPTATQPALASATTTPATYVPSTVTSAVTNLLGGYIATQLNRPLSIFFYAFGILTFRGDDDDSERQVGLNYNFLFNPETTLRKFEISPCSIQFS